MKRFFLVLMFFVLMTRQAGAISIIRDTEAEELLLGYIRPIFRAGSLNPDNAEVVIVNDPSVNAFVSGGQTIFVHTGLIMKSKTADELAFVLSHETGHIIGGHISRGYQALQNAQTTALISTVIGGVLAVAGGHPEAGIALMAGGQNSSMGLFIRYRQTEESSADRIAVDIMKKLGYSMIGFENMMKTIKTEDRLNAQSPDSYLMTHPLTDTRVNELKAYLINLKPARQDVKLDLVRAKLNGFLEKPDKVLSQYQGNTLPDLYARAISYYRKNDFQTAFELLDELIKRDSNNPYFYELKGQLFFETGQLEKAAENYRQAYLFHQKAPLIVLSYAQVLLEIGGKTNAIEAEALLNPVVQKDFNSSFGWQLLSKAYYLQGKKKEAEYATIEYLRAINDLPGAQRRAKRILDSFPENSVISQRLKDIMEVHYQK